MNKLDLSLKYYCEIPIKKIGKSIISIVDNFAIYEPEQLGIVPPKRLIHSLDLMISNSKWQFMYDKICVKKSFFFLLKEIFKVYIKSLYFIYLNKKMKLKKKIKTFIAGNKRITQAFKFYLYNSFITNFPNHKVRLFYLRNIALLSRKSALVNQF